MSNAKHTPGPWPIAHHYDAPNTYCPFITVGPAQVRFTQGYVPENDAERKARAEADARLIAEAPAMLEALRSCALYFAHDPHRSGDGWLGEVAREVRAILARIDGEGAAPTAQPAGERAAGHAFTVIWGNIDDDSGKRLDHVTVSDPSFAAVMDAAFACYFADREASGEVLTDNERAEIRANAAYDGWAIIPGHVTDAPGLHFD